MAKQMRINEDRDFIIERMNESLKYGKKTLKMIKEHPEKVDIDMCYSGVIGDQSAIALYKYALGEPISEVKKYFGEAAKFSKERGDLYGFISLGHGRSAIYLAVISDDIDLAKEIASMTGHERNKDMSWPESRFCAYALRDLILGNGQGVLGNVSKIKEKKSDIEFYYEGQMCKGIIVPDLRLLQDNLNKSLKKHDNLVKYGSYNPGKDSKVKVYPAGYFCIPTVALTKLAKSRGLEVEVEQIPENLRKYLPMELVE